MNSGLATTLPTRALLAAAVAYGLLIHATLPAGVVACNDDFGYLKSVVQTLQHGRPWTNDWLEPWSASLSAFSALIYGATGNFLVATQGLQCVFAALSFFGAAALLHARGLRATGAIACAFILLTFPVLFWKTLEYTSVTLYLPCLWWALWAAERGRWILFFIAWALAAASRQSAVAWLALPAFELTRSAVRRDSVVAGAWRGPAVVLLFAGAWLAVLFGGMNTTHAQVVRTGAIFWRANAEASLTTFAAGLAVLALSLGVGAFVLLLASRGASPVRPRSLPAMICGALVALAAFFFDERTLLAWDVVTLQGATGWLYGKLLVAAAIAGWLLVRVRLAPAPLALAIASLILVSLRGDRYDYYFADAAIAALFCVRFATDASTLPAASAPARDSAWLRLLPWAMLLALLPLHIRFAYGLKLTLDRAWALCSLYEPALRAGKIAPPELRDAPFGYAGWHLHAHSATKGSDTFRRFFDFDRRSPSVEWQMADTSPGKRDSAPGSTEPTILADQSHSLGWYRTYRFILRRTAPATAGGTLGEDYRFIPFPLNNAEWKSLIEGPRL